MITRRLGNTEFELSLIGLGTWAIGGANWSYGWGEQDGRESIATIVEALECGVNWIDTAHAYGFGVSEEVVGKAIREWGKPVIVATKCSRLPTENREVYGCLKRESILNEVEGSLRRLQVDVIDLYQIHFPEPDEDIEEGFETLLGLKEQGKIRYIGVSNFKIEHLNRVSKLGHVSSLQPQYNLLTRDIEEEILPWCAANETGVVVYSPMKYGLLTGKVNKEWVSQLPDNDWRKTKNPLFHEPQLSAVCKLVSRLEEISGAYDRPVSQLAINWVLQREEVTSAIVGARRKGQISETTAALDWQLSAEDLRQIELALADYEQSA